MKYLVNGNIPAVFTGNGASTTLIAGQVIDVAQLSSDGQSYLGADSSGNKIKFYAKGFQLLSAAPVVAMNNTLPPQYYTSYAPPVPPAPPADVPPAPAPAPAVKSTGIPTWGIVLGVSALVAGGLYYLHTHPEILKSAKK